MIYQCIYLDMDTCAIVNNAYCRYYDLSILYTFHILYMPSIFYILTGLILLRLYVWYKIF